MLSCRHLVAESENGVRIQVHAALIASLLIVLWTGRKPTKRTFEALQFYFLGWVSEEELDEHIAGPRCVWSLRPPSCPDGRQGTGVSRLSLISRRITAAIADPFL